MKRRQILGATALFAMALNATSTLAQSAKGQIVDRQITSVNFAGNRMGVSPVRKMVIYLPPGYLTSTHRYPVIYFLPNPFEENFRFDFDHRDAQGLFDRAISEGVIEDFILVAVDMNTPLGSSWYVNSSVTGNWEDFIIQELVPYIDANFRDPSQQGFTRHCRNLYWRIWSDSLRYAASGSSLDLCMRCIRWGPGPVSASVHHFPNGIFWRMPSPWMM